MFAIPSMRMPLGFPMGQGEALHMLNARPVDKASEVGMCGAPPATRPAPCSAALLQRPGPGAPLWLVRQGLHPPKRCLSRWGALTRHVAALPLAWTDCDHACLALPLLLLLTAP